MSVESTVGSYGTREGTCEFYFLTCSDDLICCSNDLMSCLHNLSSCSYTVLCMFLSVCLSTSSNIICICARPFVCSSVRLYAYFCVIVFVTLLVCMFSFPSFVRPNVRPFSVRMIMHAGKSINMSVTYLISNFLLLISNI